jgi:hypothetical protein
MEKDLDYTTITADKFWFIYNQNEELNAHSDNVVHLANLVGSENEIAKAENIKYNHMRLGNITDGLDFERNILRKQLEKKLKAHIFK